jgi:hypothetical protein
MKHFLIITLTAALLVAIVLNNWPTSIAGIEEPTGTANPAEDSSLNPYGLNGFYFDGPTQMKDSTGATIASVSSPAAANPAADPSLDPHSLNGFYFDGPTQMKATFGK